MLARASAGRVERHLRHATHVRADSRQGANEADAAGEPLVERAALRHRARSGDFADSLRRALIRALVRFHPPRARAGNQRWADEVAAPRSAAGRLLLPG